MSVESSELERLDYLERASKWFKVRAVSIVIVFAGVAVATVASLSMMRGHFTVGAAQSTEMARILATSAINTLPKTLITSVFVAAWYVVLALPLVNLARYFRISGGAVVAAVVAPSVAYPISLAAMYNWLMERAYLAVKEFLKKHISEFATAFMSKPPKVNLILKLSSELSRTVAQAILPANLVSLLPIIALAVATYLVFKLSKVVKSSVVKALWVLYLVSIILAIVSALTPLISSANLGMLILVGAVGSIGFVINIVVAVLEWLTGSRIKDYVAEVRRSTEEAELLESAETSG